MLQTSSVGGRPRVCSQRQSGSGCAGHRGHYHDARLRARGTDGMGTAEQRTKNKAKTTSHSKLFIGETKQLCSLKETALLTRVLQVNKTKQ